MSSSYAHWGVRATTHPQNNLVRRYFFSRRAKLPNGDKPAQHGIELLFVFGTLSDIPLYTPVQADLDLSFFIMGYQTRLGRTGDPNGSGALAWPLYDTATDRTLVLDSPLSTVDGVRTDKCDTWDALAASQGP